MKKIFKDLCPVFETKEAQEKEEQATLSGSKSDGKKIQRRDTAAYKKKKMIRCLANYEKDIRSFEAAWSDPMAFEMMNTRAFR